MARRQPPFTHPMHYLVLLLIAVSATGPQPQSPYVGEEHRAIKALSQGQIEDYIAGRGMGLARAAELNGYPGPKHVMELADQLDLTDEQRQKTARLFDRMQEQAQAIGRQIIVHEQALDALFADRSITPQALGELVGQIASLEGELRAVHLATHLVQAEILTTAQIDAYSRARGYHDHQHH